MKPFTSEQLSREERVLMGNDAMKTLKLGLPSLFNNNRKRYASGVVCHISPDGEHLYEKSDKLKMRGRDLPLNGGYEKLDSISCLGYEHFKVECKHCRKVLFSCEKIDNNHCT